MPAKFPGYTVYTYAMIAELPFYNCILFASILPAPAGFLLTRQTTLIYNSIQGH